MCKIVLNVGVRCPATTRQNDGSTLATQCLSGLSTLRVKNAKRIFVANTSVPLFRNLQCLAWQPITNVPGASTNSRRLKGNSGTYVNCHRNGKRNSRKLYKQTQTQERVNSGFMALQQLKVISASSQSV